MAKTQAKTQRKTGKLDNKRRIATLALAQIAGKGGRLTAEKVVEHAADPTHPLHGFFEWDDTEAARKYRIAQARELIAWAQMRVKVNNVTMDVSAFVRDRSLGANEPGYVSVLTLRKNPDEARMAVVGEFNAAAGHLRRARDLAVALGFAGEIESLIRDLTAVSGRIGKESAA